MPTPSENRKPSDRTAAVLVRLFPEERERLTAIARRKGIKRHELIRRLIGAELKRAA